MMERKLTEFRRSYARRWRIWLFIRLFCNMLLVLAFVMLLRGERTSSMIAMFSNSITMAANITGLQIDRKVLKDAAKLKEAYLQEHDERNTTIRLRSGSPVLEWSAAGLFMVSSVLIIVLYLVPLSDEMEMLILGAYLSMWLSGFTLQIIGWSLKKYWEKRM